MLRFLLISLSNRSLRYILIPHECLFTMAKSVRLLRKPVGEKAREYTQRRRRIMHRWGRSGGVARIDRVRISHREIDAARGHRPAQPPSPLYLLTLTRTLSSNTQRAWKLCRIEKKLKIFRYIQPKVELRSQEAILYTYIYVIVPAIRIFLIQNEYWSNIIPWIYMKYFSRKFCCYIHLQVLFNFNLVHSLFVVH